MAGNFDDIIRQVLGMPTQTASLTGSYGPNMQTETHAPDIGIGPLPDSVPVPVEQPVYPEINGGYPGPFLRDPGELDPWEERDIG